MAEGVHQFTLFWRTGDRNVVSGRSVAEAMTLAGFSAGSVSALDFYANGDCHDYVWEKERREWMRIGAAREDSDGKE